MTLFGGQATKTGGWLSVTVTEKLQVAEPQSLLAVQTTMVVPTGKLNGEVTSVLAGNGPPAVTHWTVMGAAPEVVVLNVTDAVQTPASATIIWLDGQVMPGVPQKTAGDALLRGDGVPVAKSVELLSVSVQPLPAR